MVSPSVLGAATGVGLALLIGVSLVIYRYYTSNQKATFGAPSFGRQPDKRKKVLVLTDVSSAMSRPPQQNFNIFREQPQRTTSLASSSTPTPPNSAPPTGRAPPTECVHVRLSLPDVHLPDDKVSPSHSSYSLPSMRRRSPVVSRARSVDARAMPLHIPRLSISGRSDSQFEPRSPLLRTPSPESLGVAQCNSGDNYLPASPNVGIRPRSLSPLLSPAYSQNSESGPSPGAVSPIGAIQPDLYKKQEKVIYQSGRERNGKSGRLHFRVKYDFNRSDLIITVIEALDLGTISENGFNDPYIKVTLLPEVDSKQRQTDIRRNSTDPFFNEMFKFPVSFDELPDKTLLFQVFDYDRFSRNDVTGEVRVPLCDIDATVEVEVWSEIIKKEKVSIDRPEILLSLSYLPSAGRLTVVVLKASNLISSSAKDVPDSYVKVALLCGDRRTKKKKTTIKKGSKNPVWNEALTFDISEEELKSGHLSISVVNCHHGNAPLLGACVLGAKENGQEFVHWRDILTNPRKSIAMWHTLRV